VLRIADLLVEGTYRRAAYIAHTKIAYPPKGRRLLRPRRGHPCRRCHEIWGKRS
jgi:hypothetical protein